LRRAGYDALALICESQSDLWHAMFAAEAAHQTIDTEYSGSTFPPLASVAYGASRYADDAAFQARAQNIETFTHTGYYCARALLAPLSDEAADTAEAGWIWDFAVTAINTAMSLDSEEEA
jgi:hypothetical protein